MADKMCAGEDVRVGNLFKTLFQTSLPNPWGSDKNVIERAFLNEQHEALQPEDEYSDNPTWQEEKGKVVENTSQHTSEKTEKSTHVQSFNENVTIGYFKPLQKYVWPLS